jgi:putative ABC transport system substrate-binding protein
VRTREAFGVAFEQAQRDAQALLLLPDPVTSSYPREIAVLAIKHRLPSIYPLRSFVDAGGLMAYAPDLVVHFRRAADYVDKILKGAKPADLPIEQSDLALIINLKTAKALGLTVPESILLRADEVIR